MYSRNNMQNRNRGMTPDHPCHGPGPCGPPPPGHPCHGPSPCGPPPPGHPCHGPSPCGPPPQARPYRRDEAMQESRKQSSCDCMPKEHRREKCRYPVGMAYVPWQELGEIYCPEKGLHEGTLFPELNLIFCGVRGGCS